MSSVDNHPSREYYKLLMKPTKLETLEQARRKLKIRLDNGTITQEDYDLFYEMLDLDGKDNDRYLDPTERFND